MRGTAQWWWSWALRSSRGGNGPGGRCRSTPALGLTFARRHYPVPLQELGGATFNGAFSTWLAVVPLATAVSYIFEVFFKLISLILLFATFHAIVVLPVILSLIGPEAHPADFRAKMDALYENEGDEGAAEHGGKAGAAEAGDHGAKEEKRSSSSSSPSVAVASV